MANSLIKNMPSASDSTASGGTSGGSGGSGGSSGGGVPTQSATCDASFMATLITMAGGASNVGRISLGDGYDWYTIPAQTGGLGNDRIAVRNGGCVNGYVQLVYAPATPYNYAVMVG